MSNKASGSTKPKKRVTHQQKDAIVEGKALGIPERDIGQEIGLAGGTVNRVSHQPDIRDRINQLATELVEEGHQAVKQNILSTIQESNEQGVKPGSKDTNTYKLGLRKLSLQASRAILDITGLTSTQPSTVIQSIINVEGNAVISDPIRELLNKHSTDSIDVDTD